MGVPKQKQTTLTKTKKLHSMSTSEISNKIDNMSLNDTASVSSKSSTASNAPKTPVSLLQELYVRKGITPKYDLVQIEGAVHEPTFKYRVTVGELVATGCGQSKKKAKHTAAKAMLDKLIALQQNQPSNGTAGQIDSTALGLIQPPKASKVVELPKDLGTYLSIELCITKPYLYHFKSI